MQHSVATCRRLFLGLAASSPSHSHSSMKAMFIARKVSSSSSSLRTHEDHLRATTTIPVPQRQYSHFTLSTSIASRSSQNSDRLRKHRIIDHRAPVKFDAQANNLRHYSSASLNHNNSNDNNNNNSKDNNNDNNDAVVVDQSSSTTTTTTAAAAAAAAPSSSRQQQQQQQQREAVDPSLLPACVRVAKKTKNNATVYLVGTCHLSNKSAEEARQVVALTKPDAVLVELSRDRLNMLTDPWPPRPEQITELNWKNAMEAFRSQGVPGVIALATSYFYITTGLQYNVVPGAEFRAAVEEAYKHSAQVYLMDRGIMPTLSRIRNNLSLWRAFRVLAWMLGIFRDISNDPELDAFLDKNDLGGMTDYIFAKYRIFERMPQDLRVPYVDERDQYMASVIRQVQGEVIVAVAGMAHIAGIERHLNEYQEDEVAFRMKLNEYENINAAASPTTTATTTTTTTGSSSSS